MDGRRSRQPGGRAMNKITKTSGIKVKSNVKAGGFGIPNHNRLVKTSGIKVKSNIKAGGFGIPNHNRILAA
jgi:hypothetical protein